MDEEFLREDTGCLLATRVESSISESTWVFRREMIDRLDVNAVVLQIMRVQQAHFSFFMPAFFLLHASNSGPFCLKKREEGKEKGRRSIAEPRLWYFSALVVFGFSRSAFILQQANFPSSPISHPLKQLAGPLDCALVWALVWPHGCGFSLGSK